MWKWGGPRKHRRASTATDSVSICPNRNLSVKPQVTLPVLWKSVLNLLTDSGRDGLNIPMVRGLCIYCALCLNQSPQSRHGNFFFLLQGFRVQLKMSSLRRVLPDHPTKQRASPYFFFFFRSLFPLESLPKMCKTLLTYELYKNISSP